MRKFLSLPVMAIEEFDNAVATVPASPEIIGQIRDLCEETYASTVEGVRGGLAEIGEEKARAELHTLARLYLVTCAQKWCSQFGEAE